MQIRFLGKESTPGDSPTLWDTDGDEFVIRGYVLDADTMAQVGDLPPGEADIRVPKKLMRHLPEEFLRHGADH